MPDLEPVSGDPFSTLVPVSHDPFALMTHYAEQPNPAQPYIDVVKNRLFGADYNPIVGPNTLPEDYGRELLNNPDILDRSIEQAMPFAGMVGTIGSVGGKVMTPEFRKWFGNSKLVDETGKPSVLYHGTGDEIHEFDLDHPNRHDAGWLGKGVYMTTSPRLGTDYSFMKKEGRDAGPNVMPLHARLENPYYATPEDKLRISLIQHNEGKEAAQDAADAWTKELKARGHDGVILNYPPKEVASAASEDPISRAKFWAAHLGSRDAAISHLGRVLEQAKSYPKNFDPADLSKTRDAIVHLRSGRDLSIEKPLQEVVAFSPSAVKSATGNRGTFNIHDPRLSYGIAGAAALPAAGYTLQPVSHDPFESQ